MALLIVPILGMGALVIDIGAVVQERRELQSGADAAALAVAKDCAAGDCASFDTMADDFADANADDGDSNIEDVCGDGPGLAECADPPDVPEAAEGYVMVEDSTSETSSGGDQITFGLAAVLGFDGRTGFASAVAAWGPVGAATTIPLTFSLCEYEEMVDAGGLEEGPPFSGSPQTVYFHGSVAGDTCPSGPSGGDLPGGFGWLETEGDCQVDIEVGDWVGDKPGVATPSTCDPSAWQNITVLLPIYDAVNGLTGNNGEYHILGFAAFHVVGYKFSGATWPASTSCPLQPGASGRCLVGYFTGFVTSGDEFGGPDMGAMIVKMVG